MLLPTNHLFYLVFNSIVFQLLKSRLLNLTKMRIAARIGELLGLQ